VQLVRDDLGGVHLRKSRLWDILVKKGGKYKGHNDGEDSVMFSIYTGVHFKAMVPDRRGMTVLAKLETPPGRGRSSQAKARAAFWEGISGKRLMMGGGLVTLLWKSGGKVEVHLGTVASPAKDIADSAKQSQDHFAVRLCFFDQDVELRILRELKYGNGVKGDVKLIEAPVMFEAIQPFLEALRVEPESIPFSQYLAHHPPEFFDSFNIAPPRGGRGFEPFGAGCVFGRAGS
jgi:hypothetical protein